MPTGGLWGLYFGIEITFYSIVYAPLYILQMDEKRKKLSELAKKRKADDAPRQADSGSKKLLSGYSNGYYCIDIAIVKNDQ
jgi:hypothetical protein